MTDKLEIRQFVVGMAATNCYLAIHTQTGEALIVDPGAGAEAVSHEMRSWRFVRRRFFDPWAF